LTSVVIHAPPAGYEYDYPYFDPINIQVHDGSLAGNLKTSGSSGLVCVKNTGGNCGGLNTCNLSIPLPDPGCIDGNMIMNTLQGPVAVKDITTGMSVQGSRNGEQAWCVVTSNSPAGRGPLVGDFTPNHLVVQNGALQPSGQSGPHHVGDLYNLASDCELLTNSQGISFAPFAFVGRSQSVRWYSRLSLSQYYTFFQALRAVGSHLSIDIFDLSQFIGDHKIKSDSLLDAFVDCLFADRNCAHLNTVLDDFVNHNLKEDSKKAIKKVFKDGAAIVHTAKTHRLK